MLALNNVVCSSEILALVLLQLCTSLHLQSSIMCCFFHTDRWKSWLCRRCQNQYFQRCVKFCPGNDSQNFGPNDLPCWSALSDICANPPVEMIPIFNPYSVLCMTTNTEHTSNLCPIESQFPLETRFYLVQAQIKVGLFQILARPYWLCQ